MYKIFINLWSLISKKRKLQALLIVGVTALASLAELLTLSTFIIMLNFIINPNKELPLNLNNIDFVKDIFNLMSQNSSMVFSSFIFCVLISGSLRLLLLWSTLRYSFTTGSDFAKTIFYNTLTQPLEYHIETSSNEILNSLTKKVHLICFEILMPLIIFASHFIIILFISTFIVFIIGIINTFLMILVITILYLIVWTYSKKIINKNSLLISKDTDKLVTFIQESFSVIRLILLRGIQRKFANEFDVINRNIKLAEGTNLFLAQGTRVFIETVFLIFIAIISILALQNTNINAVLPLIGAFGLASLRILPLVQRAYQGYVTVRSAYYSFFDLLKYLSLPSFSATSIKNSSKVLFKKSIKLTNITYKYPNSQIKVLDKLNIEIPVNKITIIRGPTGSGKSTIISILLGLIKAVEGNIYIDKVRINAANQKDWQSMISYMPQETVILDNSLINNLNFLINNELDYEDYSKFLRVTKLDKFIDLYLKNTTKSLGEKGSTISGGEKQRVSLSRTLIENKPVLILDEPSSALDHKTTEFIFSYLKEECSNKTIIVITHDQSILKFADQIIDLEKTLM